MDQGILFGFWKNTKVNTKGIANFEVKQDGEEVVIQINGIADGYITGNWGEANLKSYGKTTTATLAIAWETNFSSPQFDADLSIYLNKGLIVIAAMIAFKNQSEKSNIFIREFFAKQ